MIEINRCGWCNNDKLYQAYHDSEWGVPCRDDKKLFEFLILEGAQAGLSWITILKRREQYRQAFCGFQVDRVAEFTTEGDTPIINHWISQKEIPATTEISDRISREMKKRGFRFFGSTICYAFMQAMGMVNDHQKSCFKYLDTQ